MAKKQGKKSINVKKIVFVVIIAIVLIVAGYSLWNYQKEKASEREINRFIYYSLACVSNCSIKLVIGQNSTAVVFDSACIEKCRTGSLEKYPVNSKDPVNQKNADRLITASPEFLSCKSIYDAGGNADKYKACLQEVLPILKERYNIS